MFFFFFQAEDGIRDRSPSRGLGDVYKRQMVTLETRTRSCDPRCCGTTRALPPRRATWSTSPAVRRLGRTPSDQLPVASSTVTKLRWLAQHEPQLADRVLDVLLPHDWLTARILGDGAVQPGAAVTDRAVSENARGEPVVWQE